MSAPDPALLNRLSWEEKARQNPLWAVMSTQEFETLGSDPAAWTEDHLKLFFAKGEAVFEIFLQPTLRRVGFVPETARVIEYGSGMGRILRTLHRSGYQCAGIDISPTMLANSRILVPAVTDLHLVDAEGRTDLPSESADFVFSYAVLQHIASFSRVRVAISEICRLVKPNGLVKLQFQPSTLPFRVAFRERHKVITFDNRSLWFKWVALRGRPFVPRLMQEWSIPLVFRRRHGHWTGVPLHWRALERLLNQNGVRMLGIERDPGAAWTSAWVLGRKVS